MYEQGDNAREGTHFIFPVKRHDGLGLFFPIALVQALEFPYLRLEVLKNFLRTKPFLRQRVKNHTCYKREDNDSETEIMGRYGVSDKNQQVKKRPYQRFMKNSNNNHRMFRERGRF